MGPAVFFFFKLFRLDEVRMGLAGYITLETSMDHQLMQLSHFRLIHLPPNGLVFTLYLQWIVVFGRRSQVLA